MVKERLKKEAIEGNELTLKLKLTTEFLEFRILKNVQEISEKVGPEKI